MLLLLLACHPKPTDSVGDSDTGVASDSQDSDPADPDSDSADSDSADSDSADSDSDSGPDCPDAFADTDGDGFGDPNAARPACDTAGTWVSDATDCEDGDVAVHPGAVEVCDGHDNDCDSSTPEAGLVTWSADDGSFADFTATLAPGTPTSPVTMALDDGTYSFCSDTWYVNLDAEQSMLHLVGYDGAVLDGSGSGTVLTVRGGTVEVRALVLQHGEGNYMPDNGAGYSGGAIACGQEGVLSLDDSTLRENHAAIGGAVLIEDCNFSASNTEMVQNSATYGGGLYAFGGATAFDSSSVHLNTAVLSGGGLGLEGVYGPVSIDILDTTIEENGAEFGGGLVLYEEASATCTGAVTNDGGFHSNTAESDGGAVYMTGGDFDPTLSTMDCDFGEPSADNDPSDIFTNAGAYTYGDDTSITCSNAGCG